MGGLGSGRWDGHTRAITVEECRSLSIYGDLGETLQRDVDSVRGSVTWESSWSNKTASIGWEFQRHSPSLALLTLHYTRSRNGEQQAVSEPVSLTTTKLPKGGRRWWFRCPLCKKGSNSACNKRVGKLYLPPGGIYFGCRSCYGLTYTSSQESHRYDDLYNHLALQADVSPAMVKRFLKGNLF